MQEKFIVEIVTTKDESKFAQYHKVCDTLIDASRIMLTFKPKRGYEIVNVMVTKTREMV